MILCLVIAADNALFTNVRSLVKIKDTMFSMDPDSVPWPYRFSGKNFHA